MRRRNPAISPEGLLLRQVRCVGQENRCIPCKEIPFKSLTASEKAMLAAWQDQESGNGDHDMYMGKNLLVVNSYLTAVPLNELKSKRASGAPSE
jgi:hypothetical protein